MEEKHIICKDCGKEFILTWRDINFFSCNGMSEPKRCSLCRSKRRRDARIIDLTPHIGKYITRTKPAWNGDRSYFGVKIKLVGISPDNDILYEVEKNGFCEKKGDIVTLSSSWNDGYWKVVK